MDIAAAMYVSQAGNKMTELTKPESAKNRDIEVLRAVAICYVIAMHWVPHFLGRFGSMAAVFERYTALWSGVDLFFCISGYVIARSTLPAGGAGASLRNFVAPFWIRRIFRLWPSAWLWAVIPVILPVLLNASGRFGSSARAVLDAGAAIFNVANFHYFECLQTQTCGPLSVYWSLSLEEQFYWIFPLLLLALQRRALVAVLIALAAVQIILPRTNSFLSADPSLLWLVRTDAICLGVLLAVLERPGRNPVLPYVLRTPVRAGVVTITLLNVLAMAAAPAFRFPQATGVLALASAALVWVAGFDRDLILPRTRFDPAVLWLGSRSYSLYLTHTVMGRVASELRDRVVLVVPHIDSRLAVLTGLSLTIGLTFGVSELNFRFLETPLRAVGRRLSKSVAGVRPQRVARAPA